MRFIYKPEGAEPRTWDFAPDRLMSPEAEAIERLTGMTYTEWGDAVARGSMIAIHGLLYVMLKRSNPVLKWDEVQFCLADVDFEVDDAESDEIREALLRRVESGEVLSDADAAVLEQLQKDVDVEAPKEPDPEPAAPALVS